MLGRSHRLSRRRGSGGVARCCARDLGDCHCDVRAAGGRRVDNVRVAALVAPAALARPLKREADVGAGRLLAARLLVAGGAHLLAVEAALLVATRRREGGGALVKLDERLTDRLLLVGLSSVLPLINSSILPLILQFIFLFIR